MTHDRTTMIEKPLSKAANPRLIVRHAVGWLLVSALVGGIAAGCSRLDPPPPSHVFADPDVRFPIQVANERAHFDVAVARSKDGISASKRRDLNAFLADYKRAGHRDLYLSTSSAHTGNPAVSATIDELYDIFDAHGISANSVRVSSSGSTSYGNPWITLSYNREVAVGPECGIWEHNLADDRSNIPYDNLGCAQQNNLAAMIAYPSDLENVRAMSPRSGERRGHVWKKYVKGELGKKEAEGKKPSFGAGK